MAVVIVREDPLWPVGNFERLWPYLEKAMDRVGERPISKEEMVQAVIGNAMALWSVKDGGATVGAIATRFVRMSSAKLMLEISFAGSEKGADVWPEALAQLKDYARAYGSSSIGGMGRSGWAKALSPDRIKTMWEIDL